MTTNETRWGMQTVLSHYLHRWPIEVLFKATKQNLGLGDYQYLRHRAVERYLHLVMIAHLLLTHLATGKFNQGPYSSAAAQTQAVPEPSTFVLAAVGLLSVLTGAGNQQRRTRFERSSS